MFDTQETDKNNDKAPRWQFWFLVAFSLLLAVTFIFYLPMRFLYHAGVLPDHMTDEHEDETDAHENGEEAHGEAIFQEEADVRKGAAVSLNIASAPVFAGQEQKFVFFVNEKPERAPILLSELEIGHEKIMHVIGVRSDMNEFFHIHPIAAEEPGVLEVNYVFQKPGRYKIWSEIKKDGVNHIFGHSEIKVEGEGTTEAKEVSFARNRIVGGYAISLNANEPVVAGHEHELVFDVHTLTGGDVLLEDYLGAQMHLTVIKDDWKQFIHTHPEEEEYGHAALKVVKKAFANGGAHTESASEEIHGVSFSAVFPTAGLYKVFGQFRPQDGNLGAEEAFTAEFWIQVEEKAPFPISPWWLLLILSLVLMSILGFSVHKYINGN